MKKILLSIPTSLVLTSFVVSCSSTNFNNNSNSNSNNNSNNNDDEQLNSKLIEERKRLNNLDYKFNWMPIDLFQKINNDNIESFLINFNKQNDFKYKFNIIAKNNDKTKFKIHITYKNESAITDEIIIDSNVILIESKNIINPEKSRYNNYSSYAMVNFVDSIPKSRKINDNFYDSPSLLKNKYKNTNFNYPGWNHSYKIGENRYIEFKGNKIDLCDELLNEFTDSDKKYKFNNVEWIRNEIKNNKLKRHPASRNQYEINIDEISETIDRKFTISTAYPGTYPLGLWAPAGEIVEVNFDDETYNKLKFSNWKDISIIINNNFWDNFEANNSGRISNRYPFIETSFDLETEIKQTSDENHSIFIASPFGGNITISIDSPLYIQDNEIKAAEPITFTVKNAIKTLFFIEGQTTNEEWNEQIKDVKNKKIAPSFDAITSYASLNIPFTRINEIGYIPIEQIVYPKETFEKLNDFMFLSNYINSRDVNGNIRKLNMKFNDDLWSDAIGFGGSNTLWCDPKTGATTFLMGTNSFQWWSFTSNWLSFHEINHNYENNDVLFKWIPSLMHAQTNRVNIFDFAKTGDMGRWRNHWNFYGEPVSLKPGFVGMGPAPYANQFSLIAHYKILFGNENRQKGDEYSLYAMIMHLVGPDKWANYIRWAKKNHPNTDEDWTYMNEIESMSNYFKINLWPAIMQLTNDYNWNISSPLWNNGVSGPKNRWPKNFDDASDEEKQIINKLNNELKSIDFVGNLYACGSYIYNETNNFQYTSDTVPAFEIPLGKEFKFDFKDYIVSANPNFKWTKFEASKPKYGSIIEIDNNLKQLTYKPNLDYSHEIDEFDLTIFPDEFENKAINYVPAYKWKIKIRQNASSVHFKISKDFEISDEIWEKASQTNASESDINTFFKQANGVNIISEWDYGSFDQWYFDDIKWKYKKQSLNSKFRFVALEDGDYEFNFNWANAVRIKINNEIKFQKVVPLNSNPYQNQSNYDNNLGKYKYNLNMKKGESLLFEIDVISTNNYPYDVPGTLGLNVFINNNQINYLQNILTPFIDEINNNENEYINYLIDKKYLYKKRKLNYQIYDNETISKHTNTTNIQFKKSWLNNQSAKEWECDSLKNDYRLQFNNDFKNGAAHNNDGNFNFWTEISNDQKLVTIGSIVFFNSENRFNGMNNPWDDRTTDIIIKLIDANNNEYKVYDGKYGAQFDDRKSIKTIVTFDRVYTNIKKIIINPINNNKSPWFSMAGLQVFEEQIFKINNIIPLNNEMFNFDGIWLNVVNNEKYNLSNINNSSFYSQNKGNKISFNLNSEITSFAISGRSCQNDSTFDIYVNDKLIGKSINNSQKIKFNECLFKYSFSPNKTLTNKITIIQNENKPLYINSLITFKK